MFPIGVELNLKNNTNSWISDLRSQISDIYIIKDLDERTFAKSQLNKYFVLNTWKILQHCL